MTITEMETMARLIGDTRVCPECRHEFIPNDAAGAEGVRVIREDRETRALYKQALAKFGVDEQKGMVVEECAELILALRHDARGRSGREAIAEEVADVEIMVGQLREILGHNLVDSLRRAKLARLRLLLSGPAIPWVAPADHIPYPGDDPEERTL